MNSYIPSNKIEMLPENFLLINDKYIVGGFLMQKKENWIYAFKPFSGLPVDEEKDCVNDIAVYLNSKLKKITNNVYATYSYFNHDEDRWYIRFDSIKQPK